MKLLSWNCQGLGPPLTIRALGELKFQIKPDVIFLMETKMKRVRLEDTVRPLGFENLFTIEPRGRSGGLALLWRRGVNLVIEEANKNFIDTTIDSADSNGPWRATFVYGDPDDDQRWKVWEYLAKTNHPINHPWACVGDFNDIMILQEKEGGPPKGSTRLRKFRDFLFNSELMDLENKGPKFTWTNKRLENGLVKERLDRGVANGEWRLKFETAFVESFEFVGSDHNPIVLDTRPARRNNSFFFKFDARWLEEDECEDLIKDSWREPQNGSYMFRVSKKLKRCRVKLKIWSKEKFGNVRRQINKLKKDLEGVRNEARSVHTRDQEDVITKQLDDLWKNEEIYWGQRSRVKWINWGEHNTSFFHASTVQRRQRNRLVKLKTEQDEWVEEGTGLEEHIVSYFKDLFSESEARNILPIIDALPNLVTESMNKELLRFVTREEVKVAAFQLGARKSPGPDGYSGMFYQKYWSIVGEDVFFAVHSFFHSGFLLKELNQTNVVLIPKVDSPENVGQLRPISLCNFMYKIISRILVNRLKPILGGLISHNQSAFIPGRLIQDNIIVAHEAFHYLRRKKGKDRGELALKLDMNKAYDRLEWDFLEQAMLKLGFHEKWVAIVMQCVTTVTYSILINGKRSERFAPKKGLRQGDPLSPYLFIIASECLSCLVNNAVDNGTLEAVKLAPKCPPLTHLLFADDSLFFVKANAMQCAKILDILNWFCYASGQVINLNKSGVVFSKNVPTCAQEYLSTLLRVPNLIAAGKYLGLPTEWGDSKYRALEHIKSRVCAKLESWKGNLLSQAGKEVLVKAVATAIPSYSMSIFRLPIKLCSEINSRIANFWWGKKEDEFKIHWFSWENMTRAKQDGGMGFRDLRTLNSALLAKQAWRMIEGESPFWVQILKGLYFPESCAWEAKKGRRASWVWSSLLEGLKVIKDGAMWRVGNGANIDIWEDRWIPGESNPPCSMNVQGEDLNKVSELIVSGTGKWNSELLTSVFDRQTVSSIRSIPVSKCNGRDALIWPFTKNGKFSVKSGYHFVLNRKPCEGKAACSSFQFPKNLWSTIWYAKAPPKLRNFLWRACKNGLATKANLIRRNMGQSPICPICCQEEETIEHVLLLCPWVRPVWFGSPLAICINPVQVQRFDGWFLNMFEGLKAKNEDNFDAQSLLIYLLWAIWKERNDVIFKGSAPSPHEVIRKACNAHEEFGRVTKKPGISQVITSLLMEEEHSVFLPSWSKPSAGWVKLNVDGAYDEVTGKAGIGIICRDERGALLESRGWSLHCSSALGAEAAAIREALITGKSLNFVNIIVENDSSVLIESLRSSPISPIWQIGAIQADIEELMKNFQEVRFSLVRRPNNGPADWLAKQAKSNALPPQWNWSIPQPLEELLARDAVS